MHDLEKAKKDYDAGKLTPTDAIEAHKAAGDLIKVLIEHVQRVRSRELERVRVRIAHGEKVAELLLLGEHAFVITDIDAPERDVRQVTVAKDGTLSQATGVTLAELEKAIATTRPTNALGITDRTLASLREILGSDVRVLL